MSPTRRMLPIILAVAAIAAWAIYRNTSSHAAVRNTSQRGHVALVFGDELAVGAVAPGALGDGAVIDRTQPGETAPAAAARIAGALAEAKPNYVVVSLGTHDLDQRTPLDETVTALEAVIDQAQSTGALVAYLAIEPPAGVGDNWAMAIDDVCRRKQTLVVPPGGTPVAERVRAAMAPYL